MSESTAHAIACLLDDQRERWARGDCVRVEAYVQRLPALQADSDGLLDLIYNEVFLRERKGEKPSREEYQRRFPRLALPIGVQFDVHQAIDAGVSPDVESAPPTIPGHELLEEIGRGGMGRVYKARNQEHNRLVAVKLVRAGHLGKRGVRKRFVAEAQAAAALDHPHIVKVFEVGECAAGPYFVMELIDGASLDEVIQQSKQEILCAVHWLIPIAEAVHYAHGNGIIHRDLKPANILLQTADCRVQIEGRAAITCGPGLRSGVNSAQTAILNLQSAIPKIADFGMAKILRRVGGGISSTKKGTVLGTPSYMPPEQAGTDPAEVGPHSDVYSLGAILYALVTGRPPFDAGDFLATLLKVRSPEPPPPLRSLRPEVPVLLEKICHKCLNKHPADRFQSALDLVEALRHFARMADRAAGAAPVSSPTTATDASLCLVSLKTGQHIPLVKTETVVGRSQDCDLVLSGPDVSRRHCRISRTEGQVFLEDLDSTRGTCVNGTRVKRARLHDGDLIEIAGQTFRVLVGS